MRYTSEQLARRSKSIWTPVQAIGAPIQLLIFLVNVVLVAHFLSTGADYELAHGVSVLKVLALYFMTITGMFWEHDVFGPYFMAKQFFWEDFVNLIALVAHTGFIVSGLLGADPRAQMLVMCVAFVTYLANFTQFLLKGVRATRQKRAARAAQVAQTSEMPS
jgi:3-vinyl bacteriochlorophyllide hydratase